MKNSLKTTSVHAAVAALFVAGAVAGCGGGSGSAEPSGTKLLAQTGCVSSYCYGYTVLSSSQVKFYVKSAPWADLHYTVNGGSQINVRMSIVNGNNAYTVSGLKAGNVVKYFFTVGNTSGGATDTAWKQFTMGSTSPTPTPTPAPTPTPTPAPTPTPTPTGWNLVWRDEFSGSSIDKTKWNFEVNGTGYGNGELEYYTSRSQNARVANGSLIIEARKETYTGPDGTRQYTSARLNTQGKASWTYGRMEARMKLPAGQGIWPAFWMLGANLGSVGWPKCGEIDAMEHIDNEGMVHGTIHWADANGIHAQYTGASGGVDVTQWHVYSVEWNTNAIKWFVDGTQYLEANVQNNINSTEEFHKPFFAILNLAVGGDWPGAPNGSTVFPAQMLVDYVRVYQK